MTEQTPIDLAYAAMDSAPEDDAARLRYYERLSDSELFLLLTKEAEGDQISPEIFDLGDARFVLVFDREERLAQFVGKPAPYAALSGRTVTQMLDGQGIGLGVNLEVAPSQMLVPPEAVSWLVQTLSHSPDEVEARAEELYAPKGLPEDLLTALDAKLATTAGLAQNAYLVAIRYDGGGTGHMLGLIWHKLRMKRLLFRASKRAALMWAFSMRAILWLLLWQRLGCGLIYRSLKLERRLFAQRRDQTLISHQSFANSLRFDQPSARMAYLLLRVECSPRCIG